MVPTFYNIPSSMKLVFKIITIFRSSHKMSGVCQQNVRKQLVVTNDQF